MRIFLLFFYSLTLAAGPKSPMAFMQEITSVVQKEQWDKLTELLDLRQIEEKKRQEAAKDYGLKLKKIFGAFEQEIPSVISDEFTGNLQDGLPRYREFITNITGKKSSLPIYLDRLKGEWPQGGWKLSPITLTRIDKFIKINHIDVIPDFLPVSSLSLISLGELDYWEISQIIMIFFLSIICAPIISEFSLRLLLPFLLPKNEKIRIQEAKNTLSPSVRFNFFLFFSFFGLLILSLPLSTWNTILSVYKGLFVLAFFWPIINIIELIDRLVQIKATNNKIYQFRQNIPLGKKTLKVILVTLATLLMLQNWGVNVSAIFAGLGVGGIAVALAGQKTIENFFGGLVLVADRPIKVGDFCEFEGKQGYIEDIGPRSTRIRTLEQTIITIPNGEFSQMKIENWHRRNRIGFRKTLTLRYETSRYQLKALIVELKKLFVAHEKVDSFPLRVRLIDFGASSLDVEIYILVKTTIWEEYLAIQEDLMFHILQIMENLQVHFAYPSQAIYLQQDQAINSDAITQVETSWEENMQKDNVQWPDLSPEHITKMANKLKYPDYWPKLQKQDPDKDKEDR